MEVKPDCLAKNQEALRKYHSPVMLIRLGVCTPLLYAGSDPCFFIAGGLQANADLLLYLWKDRKMKDGDK